MVYANYEKLNCNGIEWSDRAKEMFENTLSVWDNDHKIIICHPNIVLNNTYFYKDNHFFDRVDWDNIDEDFKVDPDDSFISFTPEIDEPLKYIINRFRSEMYFEEDKPKYLAVIEEDSFNNHLVRCIYKAYNNELEVAINPRYEKYRPKSLYDKEARLSDDPINIKDKLKELDGKRLSFIKNI